MDYQEKAAFWENLSTRGILIFKANESFRVTKIATESDQRHVLEEIEPDTDCNVEGIEPLKIITSKDFPDKNSAIEFVKSFIRWQWTKTEQPTQESSKKLRGQGWVQYKLAFGIKIHDFKEIIEGDSYEEMMEIAENKTRQFFKNELKADFDTVEKKIGVKPIQK